MLLTIAQIAETCYEVNRAYCHTLGDYSQLPWRLLSLEIQQSAMNGVEFVLNHPDTTPELTHKNWMDFKISQGWTYGPEKDMKKKEHPCLIPYGQLPRDQRVKDELFMATVTTLSTF